MSEELKPTEVKKRRRRKAKKAETVDQPVKAQEATESPKEETATKKVEPKKVSSPVEGLIVTASNKEMEAVKKELESAKSKLSRERSQVKKAKEALKQEQERANNAERMLMGEIARYKADIKTLNKEVDKVVGELEDTSYKLAASADPKDVVPKQKLREESIVTRLNWWYKDLQGWQRSVAHIVSIALVAFLTVGGYTTTEQLVDTIGINNAILTYGIPALLSMLGLTGQFKSLTTPKEKAHD